MAPSKIRDELSVERLRFEMFRWYEAHTDKKATQVQYLTLGMLHHPQPFKGAETKHLTPFVVDALLAHRAAAGLEANPTFGLLLKAGYALVRYSALTDSAGPASWVV